MQTVYRARLINFGNIVYQGPNLDQAETAIKQAAFEAMLERQCEHGWQGVKTFSGISGWRQCMTGE
jgi:hypothetical protein